MHMCTDGDADMVVNMYVQIYISNTKVGICTDT